MVCYNVSMRLSKTFIKTLREAPKDETAKNGAYLIRAGYIHKEMAGVYDYLPLGLKVIENIKGFTELGEAFLLFIRCQATETVDLVFAAEMRRPIERTP